MKQYHNPTLMLCGIGGGSASLLPLQTTLRGAGIYAKRWAAPPLLIHSVEFYAENVREHIIRLAMRSNQKINIFGWSLGGLIAIAALEDCNVSACVKRVVAFGSPYDGTLAGHAGMLFSWKFLKGARDVTPDSLALKRVRRIIKNPLREWEMVIINGSLDPLAPYPIKSIVPDQAINGPWTHLAPMTSAKLGRKIAKLLKESEFHPPF